MQISILHLARRARGISGLRRDAGAHPLRRGSERRRRRRQKEQQQLVRGPHPHRTTTARAAAAAATTAASALLRPHDPAPATVGGGLPTPPGPETALGGDPSRLRQDLVHDLAGLLLHPAQT